MFPLSTLLQSARMKKKKDKIGQLVFHAYIVMF